MYPPSYPASPGRLLRITKAQLAGSLLLAGLLLLATLYNEALYVLFDGWWRALWGAPGTVTVAGRSPDSSIGLLLHRARSLPAVGLYSMLYLGLCLGLIFLLVPPGVSRRLVLLFYGGAGLAIGLLLLGSKVGGGAALAALASQLIHFIVSPLPVIGLVPLLRWAAAQPPTAA